MTVLNIRGVSGSGKTTLAREVLEHRTGEVRTPGYVNKFGSKRPDGWPIHACDTPVGRVNVHGRYDVKCGGCDTESDMDFVEANLQWGFDNLPGHHLFEGMIVSKSGKRFLAMAQRSTQPWHFLFLAPGLEECTRRVMVRNGGKEPKQHLLLNSQQSADSTERLFRANGQRVTRTVGLATGDLWDQF